MKKRIYSSLLLISFAIIIPLACRKSIDSVTNQPTQTSAGGTRPTEQVHQTSQQSVPFPQTGVVGCPGAPDYGDTLIFIQPNNDQDYILSPINSPAPGKYFSWPEGMTLDSNTGAINVTKSETGERFVIGYIKDGTTDTCLQSLVLGGAAYMDSIHVLSNNENTSTPYFNADPNLPSPCGSGSGTPGGPGCQFDVNGDANSKKIKIDNKTGVIDLKKTLNGTGLLGGAFGILPLNGQTVETTIYYRLNDGSNNALQHITVQLMFYNSKSQIGTGLLNNVLLKINNILTGNLISTAGNPRPPLIIITRYN